jgi:hypothetical protein
MNNELREAIGKSAYSSWKGEEYVDRGYVTTWEELNERERQKWMNIGENVVGTFLAHVRDGYAKIGEDRRNISGTQWSKEYYGSWVDDQEQDSDG